MKTYNRSGFETHQPQTWEKITCHLLNGAVVVEGNNWRGPSMKKWHAYKTERICQTNSRRHGKSVSTVWAIYTF